MLGGIWITASKYGKCIGVSNQNLGKCIQVVLL
jgi:hypothetical protein